MEKEIWVRTTWQARPGLKKCAKCGEEFEKTQRMVVVEKRVNHFRGDDKVEAFCEQHAPRRGWIEIKGRKWLNEKITVCDACGRASCWQGEFYCEESKTAGTRRRSRYELIRLGLENIDHLKSDKIKSNSN